MIRWLMLFASLFVFTPVSAETEIWKCEDLKKIQEFSSIKCGPEAVIYVPSRPNAGVIGGHPPVNRKYIEFLNQHQLREQRRAQQAEKAATEQRAQAERKEARNIRSLKSYPVTR